MTMNYPHYPQYKKLKALLGANNTLGDFISWLRDNGYEICRRTTSGEWASGQDYLPVAEFFGIDAKEFSREKDRMLEEFRKLSKARLRA